jgi:hypothetical protein
MGNKEWEKKHNPSKRRLSWDKLKCLVVADFKAKKDQLKTDLSACHRHPIQYFRQINV